MTDIIYGVLVKYYGRMYGNDLCQAMAEWMVTRIDNEEYKTRGDIMFYVWMNTSGGGVAEAASGDIQAALPHLIEDTMDRTYYAPKPRRTA